jgi:hypothetical protein
VSASTSTPEQVEAPVGPGLYLYGLVMPDARVPDGLTGVSGGAVRTVNLGPVTALVSDVADTELIGLPAEIRAHGAVLDAVALSGCSVLPVQFGTTAPDVDALASGLPMTRLEAYSDRLRELAGVVQLSLTARYDQDAVISELVDEEPEIRRLRGRTRGQPEAATYGERVRLGELVVAGFDRKRAADADFLARRLAPLVVEVRHREVGQVDTVLDAALLVRRDAVRRLEDGLEEVAAGIFPRITLRLVGPQAPYDFAEEV